MDLYGHRGSSINVFMKKHGVEDSDYPRKILVTLILETSHKGLLHLMLHVHRKHTLGALAYALCKKCKHNNIVRGLRH